jgi:hypothetical protein
MLTEGGKKILTESEEETIRLEQKISSVLAVSLAESNTLLRKQLKDQETIKETIEQQLCETLIAADQASHELTEGDEWWKKRVRQAREEGRCPYCNCTQQMQHEEDCYILALEGQISKLNRKLSTSPLSLPVAKFAEQMENALRRNRHKLDWTSLSVALLVSKLLEEVQELVDVTLKGKERMITDEAADVGNLAMMIADNWGGLRR